MFKSILLAGLTSLLLTTSAQAEDKAITMRTLLDGVNLVQLGLLTNTKQLIEEGVKEIQVARKVLEAVDHTHYLSLDEVQGYAYTKQKTNKIYLHAVDLVKNYKSGDVLASMGDYEQIIRQCVECHAKLRDFENVGSTLPEK